MEKSLKRLCKEGVTYYMIRPFDNGGNFHKEIWRASMGIYLKIRGSSETQNEVLKFLMQ